MSVTNPHFCSLTDLLSAQRSATHLVAFSAHQQIDWATFQREVEQNRSWLSNQPAQRVALCFANSYQFAIAFFACCAANKSLVLPGNYQPEAVKELEEHFDLLLHDDAIDIAHSVTSAQLTALAKNGQDLETLPSLPALNPSTIALTLFTSGSSGKPKAIDKTLIQLETEIAILEQLWGERIGPSRIESTVSHQHIYGLLFRLLWPLCAGRAFAIANLEFPEQLVHHAAENVALISSPALLKRLNEEHQTSPLGTVFSSGGPLPHSAATHSKALFGQLPIEVFGSTETGGIAYRQQLQASTPWQLFPSIDAELNNEGCLRLKSAHIDGENWYQTADECRFHDKVHFELLGRTDRIVKVEEKRISLVEVEKRLDQLDWIDESAVISMQDGQRLVLNAVIVLTPAGQQHMSQLGKGKFWLALRNELRNWLEPIAIPRRYRVLSEIPLNSQGKRQVADIEKLF
ncbi:AMP-binding protein [Vibrio sinaloensis]|uniref:AMP-binding protein n=1 Tax=Photobacterium sp. (strain ATCC 43367) TaxID=379097 RepID=UPI0035EEF49E